MGYNEKTEKYEKEIVFMDIKDILVKCDHTLLRVDCTGEEIRALCDQGMMVKGLGNRFREENGDLNCYKLLQLQGKDHSCNDLVACAARLLGETL